MEDSFVRIVLRERLMEAERVAAEAARRARVVAPRRSRKEAPARGALGGFRAALPLGLASVPFAFAYAIAAEAAGFTPLQTVLFSLVVYSGTGQLVGVGLLGAGAGPFAAAATVLALSLRHLLLGAALAPLLGRLGLARRLPLAFGLSDEAFALAVGPLREGASPAYLAGAEAGLFVTWQASVAVAAAVGGSLAVPGWVALDLVLPLSMLALLVLVARGGRERRRRRGGDAGRGGALGGARRHRGRRGRGRPAELAAHAPRGGAGAGGGAVSGEAFWLVTALVGGAVFATRLPGMLLPRAPGGAAGRALGAVPAAVFATLALPPLLLGGEAGAGVAVRADLLLAGVATAVVADATRRFEAAVAAGLVMAALWRIVGV
jgi:predicted branched-subunit amino acid permease/branched-subunit amino acid transport protein